MTSRSTRLKRLLDRGFYPTELPPTFRVNNFSSAAEDLVSDYNYAGSTTFFEGATFRGSLRTFGVINPINYAFLCDFIASEWSNISSVYKLSKCSGAGPKFPSAQAGGRAIETTSLSSRRKSQRHLAGVYPTIISLDINRFYGSIYTHSIPWAALGKQTAKQMHRSRALNGHWSDALDKLVRNCNQQQTIGIPIGPDTSRIISELLLARIDHELTTSGTGLASTQIYHNIDDYLFGCTSVGDTENAQSLFVRTISRYELRLNEFKTSVNHRPSFLPPNFQRRFDILSTQKGDSFAEHFFDILHEQASELPDANVLGYALKRFAPKLAARIVRETVSDNLQRLILEVPHQARWILPILLGIYRDEKVTPDIRRIVIWGVETCARRNDVGSVLWYLYAAIFLSIRLGSSTCTQCIGLSSELVDLMLFHGKSLNLFSFQANELHLRYQSNDFTTPSWLTLYEVERRKWDTSAAFTKIGTSDDQGNYYETLNRERVEFYSTDPNVLRVEAFEGWNLTQEHFERSRWLDFELFSDFSHGSESRHGGSMYEDYDPLENYF